jgi:hypothetical protein
MVFSASQLRFVQLVLILFGAIFILFKLRPSIHKATAPIQQGWSDHHDWDDFGAIINDTLGVMVPFQSSPGALSTYDYLGSKSLRH